MPEGTHLNGYSVLSDSIDVFHTGRLGIVNFVAGHLGENINERANYWDTSYWFARNHQYRKIIYIPDDQL